MTGNSKCGFCPDNHGVVNEVLLKMETPDGPREICPGCIRDLIEKFEEAGVDVVGYGDMVSMESMKLTLSMRGFQEHFHLGSAEQTKFGERLQKFISNIAGAIQKKFFGELRKAEAEQREVEKALRALEERRSEARARANKLRIQIGFPGK